MTGRDRRDEHDPSARGDLPAEGRQALRVLRAAWSAQGQTSGDIDEAHAGTRPCRAMESVGFSGLAGEVEPSTNRAEALHKLRSAWRRQLEREGKLDAEAASPAERAGERPAPGPTGPDDPAAVRGREDTEER